MSPEERAARERKQKIFVVVGGLILVLLLAIQVPRILGRGSGSSSAAPTTTAADTASTDATTTTSSPQTRAPAGLVDTDRPFQAAPNQLSSFNAFSGKDPFVQQVTFDNEPAAETGSEGKGAGEKGTGGKNEQKPSSQKFTVGGQPSAAVTVVSVNGARQALVAGTAFPASDPVFVLVSEQPQAKAVTIAVAGGAYASGSRTTKLRVGKPLVLVNTTTGARYKLVLVAVGNGEAKSAGAEQAPSASSKKKTP